VSFLAPWMVMLDGAARLLPWTTSLPPGTERGLVASSLVAYGVAISSCSLVVYLTMSFGA
jgi:hypothetical protein